MPLDPINIDRLNIAPASAEVSQSIIGRGADVPPLPIARDGLFADADDYTALASERLREQGEFSVRLQRDEELQNHFRTREAFIMGGMTARRSNPYFGAETAKTGAERALKAELYGDGVMGIIRSSLAMEDAAGGMERMREVTAKQLAIMGENPERFAGIITAEQLEAIEGRLAELNSKEGKAARLEHELIVAQFNQSILDSADAWDNVQGQFFSWATSPHNWGEKFGVALTMPVGLTGGYSAGSLVLSAVKFGALEGALVAPGAIERSATRIEILRGLDAQQKELEKVRREGMAEVGYAALFGAGVGGALKGAGIAWKGGKEALQNYRAVSRKLPPKQVEAKPPPKSEHDPILISAQGKKAKSGAVVHQRARGAGEGVVEVMPKSPIWRDSRQMDALEKAGSKEKAALEFDKHDYAISMDDDRVIALTPRADEPPAPKPPPPKAEWEEPEYTPLPESEGEREIAAESIGSFSLDTKAGKVEELKEAGKGGAPKFTIGGVRFANNISADGEQSLAVAREMYDIWSKGGEGVPPPSHYFKVQDGRIIWSDNIIFPDRLKMQAAFSTRRPPLPVAKTGESVEAATARGESVRGDQLANPDPDDAAEQAAKIMAEEAERQAADLPVPPAAPAAAAPPENVVGLFGREAEVIGRQLGEDAPKFFALMDEAIARGALKENTEAALDMLYYAFRNGGVEDFVDLSEVANHLPDSFLRTDAEKMRALELVRGEKKLSAEEAAGVIEGVIVGKTKLTPDGHPTGKNALGEEVVREDKRVVQDGNVARVESVLPRTPEEAAEEVAELDSLPPVIAKAVKPLVDEFNNNVAVLPDGMEFEFIKGRDRYNVKIPSATPSQGGKNGVFVRGADGKIYINPEVGDGQSARLARDIAMGGFINKHAQKVMSENAALSRYPKDARQYVGWFLGQGKGGKPPPRKKRGKTIAVVADTKKAELVAARDTALPKQATAASRYTPAQKAKIMDARKKYEQARRDAGYEIEESGGASKPSLVETEAVDAMTRLLSVVDEWKGKAKAQGDKTETIDAIAQSANDYLTRIKGAGDGEVERVLREGLGVFDFAARSSARFDDIAEKIGDLESSFWDTLGKMREQGGLKPPPKSKQDPTPARTGNKEISPLKNQRPDGAGLLSDAEGRPLSQNTDEDPLLRAQDGDNGVIWQLGDISIRMDETGGFSVFEGEKRTMRGADGKEVYNRVARGLDPESADDLKMLDLLGACLKGRRG